MARSGGRRGGEEGEESDERWLLTYGDMLTLLMALFMVLFSISSVNKSKLESLQKSLKDAFSGRVLPGGQGIAENGGPSNSTKAIAPPLANTPDLTSKANADSKQTKAQESKEFKELKKKLDGYTQKHGLGDKVTTRVTRDGLLIRLLTDKLLFDSGSATPKLQSAGILAEVGNVLTGDRHPVNVVGHTDSVPIRTVQFPSNWELSGARAGAVVRALISDGVSPRRLTALGRADLDPVSDSTSPAGRALDRRVEILLPRTATEASLKKSKASTTSSHPTTAKEGK